VAVVAATTCPSPFQSRFCSATLQMVSARDPARLGTVGAITVPAGSEEVAARDGFLYILLGRRGRGMPAGGTGVLVVDARDPERPAIARQVPVEEATSLAVDGDRLLVGADANGVVVFGLEEPSAPRRLAQIDASPVTLVDDVAASDHLLYAAGFGGLAVIDIRVPDDPRLVDAFVAEPYERNVGTLGVGMVTVLPSGRVYATLSGEHDADDHILAAFRLVRR
jgi:hypothetical protein